MAGGFTATVVGDDRVAARLRMTASRLPQVTLVALQAGGLLIQNEWKAGAPYRTGTYRRSIHLTVRGMSVVIGSNVPYARRLEYGFSGRDSLGRLYNQLPGGYARRAVATQQPAVIREVVSVIRAQLAA